jgi:hypothetical protein
VIGRSRATKMSYTDACDSNRTHLVSPFSLNVLLTAPKLVQSSFASTSNPMPFSFASSLAVDSLDVFVQNRIGTPEARRCRRALTASGVVGVEPTCNVPDKSSKTARIKGRVMDGIGARGIEESWPGGPSMIEIRER